MTTYLAGLAAAGAAGSPAAARAAARCAKVCGAAWAPGTNSPGIVTPLSPQTITIPTRLGVLGP